MDGFSIHRDGVGATIGDLAFASPSVSIASAPFFSSSEESPVRVVGERNLERRGQEEESARSQRQLMQTGGQVQ